jgi:hypothetical protein
VNTLFTTILGGLWGKVSAMFLAGLILVIAGAAMVLVFAPKGTPPPPSVEPKTSPAPPAGQL